MPEINDKVKSLIGFAIKAGKVVYGVDAILTVHKRKYLVVICNTISEKSLKQLKINAPGIPLLVCKYKPLSEITHRDNCKALALTDGQMADAILDSFNRNMYDLVPEGK